MVPLYECVRDETYVPHGEKGVPMTEKFKKHQMWFSLFILLLFQLGSGLAFAQEKAAPAASSAVSGQTADQTYTDGYVGSEACKTCHDEAYAGFEKTPHWNTVNDTRGGQSKQGCEGCHGPGGAHVDGGGDKTLIFDFKGSKPKEINARCLTCHASGTSHLNSANSFHRQNDVSCTDCHSAHHAGGREKLLIKAQPDLCYTCHQQQKSQFNMPFRHRVNEGFMTCTDCHNQHGTGGFWQSSNGLTRQVKTSASGDFVCFKCHTEKQGPFVFEHTVVKTEGCAACHIPHGGANAHMLKYSNVSLLCLSCHTSAAFGHAPLMDPAMATNQNACPLCHTQVHGPNFNNDLLR